MMFVDLWNLLIWIILVWKDELLGIVGTPEVHICVMLWKNENNMLQ